LVRALGSGVQVSSSASFWINHMYDWSVIPAEYKWVSTDSNKEIHAFKKKPFKFSGTWIVGESFKTMRLFNQLPFEGDWKNSLEKRPVYL